MKEKPILFNAAMVRAILEGRKTQTRRILKEPVTPSESHQDDFWFPSKKIDGMVNIFREQQPGWEGFMKSVSPFDVNRLWVRETWRASSAHDYLSPKQIPVGDSIEYTADKEKILTGKNRPSIFMPRWASRINLEIINIRVERLQDISEADAIAEGITVNENTPQAIDQYCRLWRDINGQESWLLNPWVWVIEFKNDH